LTSYFRLAPAVESLLAAPGNRARAVLASGPVCAVTGLREFEPIAERLRVPVVVTGPEPLDLIDAIARAVRQLELGSHMVENQYARAVRPDGNLQARAAIASVFEPADAEWRGLGRLPDSGLRLRGRFRRFDAAARFPDPFPTPATASECLDGEVLAGRLKPFECPAFGTRCMPDHPLGAAMVSAEGTCAAYYRYRRSAGLAPATPSLAVLPAQVAPGG
jgi:hydrogenase expression/formation protein HypD